MPQTKKKILGPDGYERTSEEEKHLNDLIVTTFNTQAGIETLKYLKSITTERVSGPDIEANHLFHNEGARFIVAILETRIRQYETLKEGDK